MRVKRIIAIGLACCIALSGVQVGAKSLKSSFSGGSTYKCVEYKEESDIYTYKKTTYFQTKGYSGYHYVRAYIGGSKNSASDAIADSGRKWSYGDVKATASTQKRYSE